MRTGARHTRWKEYDAIEDEFFELNHEEKAAVLRLEFEKPEEIFDCSAVTEMPLM